MITPETFVAAGSTIGLITSATLGAGLHGFFRELTRDGAPWQRAAADCLCLLLAGLAAFFVAMLWPQALSVLQR